MNLENEPPPPPAPPLRRVAFRYDRIAEYPYTTLLRDYIVGDIPPNTSEEQLLNVTRKYAMFLGDHAGRIRLRYDQAVNLNDDGMEGGGKKKTSKKIKTSKRKTSKRKTSKKQLGGAKRKSKKNSKKNSKKM